MRIGIDCRTILNPDGGEQAGVGHYVHYLVKNLLEFDRENVYILFFDHRFKNFKLFERPNVIIRQFPFYQYKKYLPLAYSQMLISAFLTRENLDVFHGPANAIPLLYGGSAVVTVHDLAVYKFPDLFPATFLNRQVFATKVLVPKSLERAKKIIAISKNTKTDIIEELDIPEEKITVIYEGAEDHDLAKIDQIDMEKIKAKFGIVGKYVLFMGTIEPRKNIISLVKAFRNLRLAYDSIAKDCQLIIAGAEGWKDEPVYQAIADANASILGIASRRNGRERRTSPFDLRSKKEIAKEGERRSHVERRENQPIKYIGYISHDEKLALLRHAECFVFPSLYEGFGLPVLEAMTLGVPIVTSNVSALPELTGENGALLVDPSKEAEIADALQQILSDPGLGEQLKVTALARAQEFSWKKCAEETLEIYREVYKEKK